MNITNSHTHINVSSEQIKSLNNNLHKIFYTNLKLDEILK